MTVDGMAWRLGIRTAFPLRDMEFGNSPDRPAGSGILIKKVCRGEAGIWVNRRRLPLSARLRHGPENAARRTEK